jgi:hypothetical protein
LAANEARAAGAQVAAESGLQFLRYHLARLDVAPQVAPDKVLEEVHRQLSERLVNKGNLGSRRLGYAGGVISVPEGPSEFISLDGTGQAFRALISASGAELTVKVIGVSGRSGAARAIQVSFKRSQNDPEIFDYGIAARGPIRVGSGAVVTGVVAPSDANLLSTSKTNLAVSVASNSVLAGEIYMSEETATADIAYSASVGGSAITTVRDSYVHAGIEPPAFPTVDTSEYWPYVLKPNGEPNYFVSGSGRELNNCILKPGSYHFNNQMTIQGVLYIQTPCSVTFGGGVSIRGVVVVQNNPGGTPGQNVLDFQGNGRFDGIETLPASTAFPADLRAKSGSLILAPNFTVNFGGNFGTVGGAIVASSVTFGGTSSGTVRGTVIGLGAGGVSATGRQLVFDHTGLVRNAPGLFFGYAFVPVMTSYTEPAP